MALVTELNFFFFKQKTAYEMRISDWSSDVCSADLALLIVVAVFVAIEVKAMLIGQGVHPLQQEQMRSWLEARPEIARVFNLITLQLGSDVMVSVKAQMREAQDAGALLAQINAVEAALQAEFPEVRWSFFEPDVADDDKHQPAGRGYAPDGS